MYRLSDRNLVIFFEYAMKSIWRKEIPTMQYLQKFKILSTTDSEPL